MSSSQPPATGQSRDGTSQAGRFAPELDPGYAQVDERTTRDLLAFAREYARELKYFGVDDPDRANGDWSGFLGPAIDLDAAAAYADAPEAFQSTDATQFARPHFALLLTFLKLLVYARAQLNDITRRHLEFHFRDVLRMVRKPAVPDQVHVLVELDIGTNELLLPAGTALDAGKDGQGQELVYRTDRELVANRVTVARIRSLRVDKKITGIKEASRRYLTTGTRKDAFVLMLRIALGQPNPGDPLPVDLAAKPPVYPGVPPANQPNPEVGFDALVRAHELVGVVAAGLGMPSFDDFRALMRWKRVRQRSDAGDWKQINAILEKAGKTRTGNPAFTFSPANPSDFLANLRTVLGLTPAAFATLFDGLPEVESMEDAYAVYAERPDVQAFIQPPSAPGPGGRPKSLYMSLDDFRSMMQTKGLMDNQWDEINQLLEKAGQRKRKNPDFTLPPEVRASRDFNGTFTAAGLDFTSGTGFQFAGDLDAYFEAFLSVERYFYMSAESFRYLMSVAPREDASIADEWAWDRAYEIVGAAHAEMILARRRNALLRAALPGGVPTTDSVTTLRDMLAIVLDEDIPLADLRQRLDTLELTDKNSRFLIDIAERRETAPDWPAVAGVLEVVQRQRQHFEVPVAEKVEWRNLYPAADATAVKALSTQPAAETLLRWKTFGRPEPATDVIPAASFGWAIASPLLALSEGTREIQLVLGLSPDPLHFDLVALRAALAPTVATPLVAGFNPFRVEVSTATRWFEPAAVRLSWVNAEMGGYPAVQGADTSKLRALVLSFALAKDEPALIPPTHDVHGIDSPTPVLRLLLKPVWNEQAGCYVTSYQVLRTLALLRARLAVSVAGLENLFIRNDQTVLDAKKPFEPFGISPAVGSRLYVGHREIVSNTLDSLRFNITWMGVPAKLGDHYQNYPGGLANKTFAARVALSDAGVLRQFSASMPLFDQTDATKPVALALTPPANQGNPATATTDSTDVAEWNRHVVWELNAPDLQHAAYPNIALQKSLEMAAAIANKTPPSLDPRTYQVNPPYTPKIKSLTLDYTASSELVLAPASSGKTARAFHVHPFGYSEIEVDGVQPGGPLLPQFDFEGELYIGLSGVAAPQNVSLLFQVAEGSANPDLAPEPVVWSYLSGNRWLTLHDGSLRADATRGLINSGIVELSLKPAEANTLFADGLYWIRAAIARSPDGVCDMVAILANAVLASLAGGGNTPGHVKAPLPAGRIAGPVAPIPGVSGIRQPYTSFGGRTAEEDSSFYVRVSERLRHKQRALTAWDYERLVLEKFPRLYKVKCLHADPDAHPREPGQIDLVVIPDIRNRLPFNPFEPKAPADLVRDVEAFLEDKTPPFAAVRVKNARYVPVKVRCGVRFVTGSDEGFCRRQLNEELNRFLSPWAYEEGADVVIGGSIYANSIINFIDSRDYVDYVAEFKLFTSEDGDRFTLIPQSDGYHARPATPDGVLVAAREHQFDVISQAEYRAEDFTGINYMKIELDFIVG